MTEFNHTNMVTAAGYVALEQKCDELSMKLCQCKDNRASDSAATPNNGVTGQVKDCYEHRRSEALVATQLAIYKQILAISSPAPKPEDDGYVHLGTVCELSKDGGSPRTYVLVGSHEPDEIWTDKVPISIASPLGRELVGRSLGDEFTVEAPGGMADYAVVGLWVPDAPHSDEPELPLVTTYS